MSGRLAAVRGGALESARPGAVGELVFEVDDVARVRERLRRHRSVSALSVGPESHATALDTYVDTADWRLHRAGCGLRYRRINSEREATLELLHGGADETRHRTIHERLGQSSARPDISAQHLRGPVGSRVRAVVGKSELLPLFEVTTERHAFPIRIDGMQAGEIVIEDSASPRGRRRRAFRLTRLRIAVRDWATSAIEPLVALVTTNPTLPRAVTPTFAAMLAAHRLEPTEPVAIMDGVTEHMTIGEVALAAVARQLGRILALEPATRLGEDREALHDMRVATRRLRAALRLFKPTLSARAERVRTELRIVGAGLGGVRDLDVQLEELERYQREDGAADARTLQSLTAVLHRRRTAARQHMLRVLDSQHYRHAVDACLGMLRHGPLKSLAIAHQPVLAVAPKLIERQYRKFRKLGDRVTAASNAEEYHALRISGKRLRYAVEFHADIYGKPARAWLQRLVELQRLLGEHQDAEIGSAHLRTLVQTGGRTLPARAMVPVGRMTSWYEARANAARAAFPRVYRKANGKRLRRFLRAMDEQATSSPRTVRVRDRATG